MKLDKFICDETGAVTIDWVALGAGILILGVGIVPALYNEVQQLIVRGESELDEVGALTPIEDG